MHRLSYITLLMIGTYFLCIAMRPHLAKVVTWIELVNTAGICFSAALVSIYLHLLKQSGNRPEVIVIEQTLIVVQAAVILFGLMGILLLSPYILAEKGRALSTWWKDVVRHLWRTQRKVSPDIKKTRCSSKESTMSSVWSEVPNSRREPGTQL